MTLLTSNGLTGALFADAQMAHILSDTRWLEAMLDFEAALAQAEAKVGVIPTEAAEAIVLCCNTALYDIAEIGRRTTLAGNPAIPVVQMLTAEVAKRDPAAAEFVHFGATSQDVIDTALGYIYGDAQACLLERIGHCCHRLAKLAEQHRTSVMPGRTLMQHALPISFGLKCAQWLEALVQCHDGVMMRSPQWLQFGGAAGNLSALGTSGIAVMDALQEADVMPKRQGRSWRSFTGQNLPWHTNRTHLMQLAAHIGILSSNMGKIARDVALLMQTEVAELFEPSAPGKGGSSTLPHKRNPVQSVAILAASARTPGLVATMLSTGIQEHERGVGGWHAEWDTMRELLLLTGAAALHMQTMLEGLEVDAARMRANVELTQGLVMAERVTFALAPSLGKAKAKKLMEAACKQAVAEKKHLRDVMETKPEAKSLNLDMLFDPTTYLGASDVFIDRALTLYQDEAQYMIEETR